MLNGEYDIESVESLQDSYFDPYSPNLFITSLSCSLVGQTRNILLKENTKVYDIYNEASIEERYNCSFGLNKKLQMDLDRAGFKVVGSDESGEARIMMIEENHFFVATLFQPQLSSTYDIPHPLLLAYLENVNSFKK
ncbi:MAG TPA: hypothetical protein VHP81_13485 [Lachnospiraceae bacterium]|nr:hypothetical protein [Lachnospiraceae bacterium]